MNIYDVAFQVKSCRNGVPHCRSPPSLKPAVLTCIAMRSDAFRLGPSRKDGSKHVAVHKATTNLEVCNEPRNWRPTSPFNLRGVCPTKSIHTYPLSS